MLLDFTGSDWCGWCVKLEDEVFTTEEFSDFANAKLIPLKIDFPRTTQQTMERQSQNRRLQQQFGISGYPTLILLSPTGQELWRGGYTPGGPGAMIQTLSTHLAGGSSEVGFAAKPSPSPLQTPLMKGMIALVILVLAWSFLSKEPRRA
jgi:thiol-disulfide isomerase/thioredoxin